VGQVVHAVNRGNDRRVIFADDERFRAFLQMLEDRKAQTGIRIYGYCLIPNHFHQILEPTEPDAVSAFLRQVCGSYAYDLRKVTGTLGLGHVFQRRFWSDPVNGERHFLNVLRYVEANALRAGLVPRAEDWRWGSLAARLNGDCRVLDPLPLALPENWIDLVNAPMPDHDLTTIRRPLRPGRPAGAR
jgi:putative transposase